MTNKIVTVFLVLLTVALLLPSVSCAKTSTTSTLRNLSEIEKEQAIQIALDTPEAENMINQGYAHKADLSWVAIKRGIFSADEYRGLDYDVWEKGVPTNVPSSAVIYPRVSLTFGEPGQFLVRVAVDLVAKKPFFVDTHPLKKVP